MRDIINYIRYITHVFINLGEYKTYYQLSREKND